MTDNAEDYNFYLDKFEKSVFFDFDGTLTYKSPNIWKAIWKKCGYDTGKGSYFSQLYVRFLTHEISHQEWCDLTCEKFIEAKFTENDLFEIADSMNTIDGLTHTLETLKSCGYSLHIISGSIDSVIKHVLGDNAKYFDSISANSMQFDNNGYLTYIQGTNYDFEGKATFINEYKEKTGVPAENLTFVGNGDNDEWAHLSGCKTICINPENTDNTNTTMWHKSISDVTNISKLLPLIITEKIVCDRTLQN